MAATAETNVQMVPAGGDGRGAASLAQPLRRVAGPVQQPMEGLPAWPMIARLPVMLAVTIPLRGFRVCDLLNLRPGQTVVSRWASTEDVPLKVGSVQLCWGEFEVVERQMALRLTRLA
jgi:hypothetical protein